MRDIVELTDGRFIQFVNGEFRVFENKKALNDPTSTYLTFRSFRYVCENLVLNGVGFSTSVLQATQSNDELLTSEGLTKKDIEDFE